MDSLSEGIRRGDRRALSRFLSRIESAGSDCEGALAALYPLTGRARITGVTGPPGVGKSTLVAALAAELRRQEATVAILAVDPTSPLTGGALLGDRVRMQARAVDPGVFVRSAGTRGAFGGLAAATMDALVALDAFGFDHILVETVGAGQDQVDVRYAAHTVLVVQAPGAGDAVQALKAGLLEVAHCYVVNKADQPGAEAVAAQLNGLLALGPSGGWVPPVVLASALGGQGVGQVLQAMDHHRAHLLAGGGLAVWRRQRVAFHIRSLAQRRLLAALDRQLEATGLLDRLAGRVCDGVTDPYAAAAEPLAAFVGMAEVR